MEKNLINIYKKIFKLKNKRDLISLKNNKLQISDLENYDSLNFLKFISSIEKKFKIEIKGSNLSNLQTYESTYNFLINRDKIKYKKK
jgi:acyl carrier protein